MSARLDESPSAGGVPTPGRKSELLGHWIDESDHEIHRRHHKRHVPGKTRLFTPLSEWIQHGFSHTRMAYEAKMDGKGNGEAEESEGKPSRTSSCLSGRFPKGAWRWRQSCASRIKMILHESSGLSKVRLQAVSGMPPRIPHVLAQAGAILYIRRMGVPFSAGSRVISAISAGPAGSRI